MRNLSQACARFLFAAALLFCHSGHAQVERFLEGVHYTRLPDNSHARELAARSSELAGRTQVLEVFWYGCGFCNAIDPMLTTWAEEQSDAISLERSPMIWDSTTKQHARLFFAVQNLELAQRMHPQIFAEIHDRKNYLLDADAIGTLLQDAGIAPAETAAQLNSFAVDSQVRKAEALNRELHIPAVPALVVAGKYLINSGAAVPSHQAMLDVAGFLVNKEQAAAGATN